MLVHAIFSLIYLSEKKAERLKHMLIVLSLKNLILDVVMLTILIAIFFSAQVFKIMISKNSYKYDMYEERNIFSIPLIKQNIIKFYMGNNHRNKIVQSNLTVMMTSLSFC